MQKHKYVPIFLTFKHQISLWSAELPWGLRGFGDQSDGRPFKVNNGQTKISIKGYHGEFHSVQLGFGIGWKRRMPANRWKKQSVRQQSQRWSSVTVVSLCMSLAFALQWNTWVAAQLREALVKVASTPGCLMKLLFSNFGRKAVASPLQFTPNTQIILSVWRERLFDELISALNNLDTSRYVQSLFPWSVFAHQSSLLYRYARSWSLCEPTGVKV